MEKDSDSELSIWNLALSLQISWEVWIFKWVRWSLVIHLKKKLSFIKFEMDEQFKFEKVIQILLENI